MGGDHLWDAIGAVAEGLGALGVIGSLIYLSRQLRQNTQSVRDATHHEVMKDYTAHMEALYADTELTDIFCKGSEDLDSIGPTERQRFSTFMLSSLRVYENIVYQTGRGRLEKQSVAGFRTHFDWGFSKPGIRQWWNKAKHLFSPDFVEFIANNHLNNETGDAPSYKAMESDEICPTV